MAKDVDDYIYQNNQTPVGTTGLGTGGVVGVDHSGPLSPPAGYSHSGPVQYSSPSRGGARYPQTYGSPYSGKGDRNHDSG